MNENVSNNVMNIIFEINKYIIFCIHSIIFSVYYIN